MTLMITGGAGYVGAQAAWAACDAGYEVLVVDDLSTGVRENVPTKAAFARADVADHARMASLMREHEVDAVLHLAARVVAPDSLADPLDYYQANVAGLWGS